MCAGVACEPNEQCCRGAFTSRCASAGVGCEDGSFPMTCDEAADCGNGELCCVESDRVRCVVNCASPTKTRPVTQLCGTDTECGAGNSCTLRNFGNASFRVCSPR